MKYSFLAKDIKLKMFIGICDFEKLQKQTVLIDVKATGKTKSKIQNINDCLDYSKIHDFVEKWEQREHVDLIETLLIEIVDFLFNDKRIKKVCVTVKKPDIFKNNEFVGVNTKTTRKKWLKLKAKNK